MNGPSNVLVDTNLIILGIGGDEDDYEFKRGKSKEKKDT